MGILEAEAQHEITINVSLVPQENTLIIQQQIVYKNTSKDTLNEIYLSDWANSFSSKTTPLAKRFSENFESAFHFEKNENRGRTAIKSIKSISGKPYLWERGKELDIIRIPLKSPLLPDASETIYLEYSVKIPDDKFTRYGVASLTTTNFDIGILRPEFTMRIGMCIVIKTPMISTCPSDFNINFRFPENYRLFSDLNSTNEITTKGDKTIHLSGTHRMGAVIYLDRTLGFKSVETDQLELITDIKDKKVTPTIKALQIDRITRFLKDKLGPYPFEKLLISDADYRSNPVYGLNQFPDFISPFPSGFEMDMELLKTISRNYIETTLP